MPLTLAQIKQEQLKLLQISGFCLAEYSNSAVPSKIFHELSPSTAQAQFQRIKPQKLQSAGFSANANLKALVHTLLHSIYSPQIKQDLLDYLKSVLYSPQLDLTTVRHQPLPQLSSRQMKKLAVEFFYSLSYSHFDDRVQSKLAKYPVIMDILILFLRIILIELKFNNADNYLFRLPTKQAYNQLIQYFDLNCKNQGKFYLFYQDRIFILENQRGQILVGNYLQNQSQKAGTQLLKQTLKLSKLSEVQEDYDNQGSKKIIESPNRSLQIRGIVSESIVFEPQAETPFFNFDQDNQSSFKSSKQPSLAEDKDYQKQTIMRMSKEMSLLKQMDRMMSTSQQIGLGSSANIGHVTKNNMKKTIIQNQVKVSIERDEGAGFAFGMAMDSPITLDSPHTMSIPADTNFEEQVQQAEKRQKIKIMKKSKSQKMSKTISDLDNSDLSQKQAGCHTHEIINQKSKHHKHKQKSRVKSCLCVAKKMKKMKINSHLYDINMIYVNAYPNFIKKMPTCQIPSSTSIQDKVKSANQVKSISSYPKIDSGKLYKQGSQKASYQIISTKTTLLDDSVNSCSMRAANPQSDITSKRQFSPLSSNDRSFSPFGGTKSISSPRITFSYKNSLKYSIAPQTNKANIKYPLFK